MPIHLPLTPVARDLPSVVPFVGPETFERRNGRPLQVRLGANESVFGISPAARLAMREAVDDIWQYNDPEAYDLREAIASRHQVEPARIQIGAGIDELLGLLVRIFAAPGDPVVMPCGSYPTFAYHVSGHGARLVEAPYREHHVDLEALATCVEQTGARLVYVANPDNPMGTWLGAAALIEFAHRLGEDRLIILDEAYADFAPSEAIPPMNLPAHVIRARTFSKAHGMAGARVGYLLADPSVVGILGKVRNHFGVNRVAQAGAIASVGDDEFVAQVVEQVAQGRNRLTQLMEDLGLECLPSATNFVNVDLEDAHVARAVLEALLDRDVFIRMPTRPPGDRHLRVTIGREPDLMIFAQALEAVLQDREKS